MAAASIYALVHRIMVEEEGQGWSGAISYISIFTVYRLTLNLTFNLVVVSDFIICLGYFSDM